MGFEIERKFLVIDQLWNDYEKPAGKRIHQLYLHADTEKAIRVRIIGDQAFITIKSKVSDLRRVEFEYEIPLADAEDMMKTYADCPQVEKTRFFIPTSEHIWEVDVFHGKNEGLIVAEIELSDEEEPFEKPVWIAEEVTHDSSYLNVNLAK
jgi:adenylate cyclase